MQIPEHFVSEGHRLLKAIGESAATKGQLEQLYTEWDTLRRNAFQDLLNQLLKAEVFHKPDFRDFCKSFRDACHKGRIPTLNN